MLPTGKDSGKIPEEFAPESRQNNRARYYSPTPGAIIIGGIAPDSSGLGFFPESFPDILPQFDVPHFVVYSLIVRERNTQREGKRTMSKTTLISALFVAFFTLSLGFQVYSTAGTVAETVAESHESTRVAMFGLSK